MPNVYIINRGGHDYSAAKRYGNLIYLSEGLYNRFSTGQIYREFKEKLKNSKNNDFIVVSGLSVMTSIACSIFSIKHQRLNLLLYNGSNKPKDSYVKRVLKLEEI